MLWRRDFAAITPDLNICALKKIYGKLVGGKLYSPLLVGLLFSLGLIDLVHAVTISEFMYAACIYLSLENISLSHLRASLPLRIFLLLFCIDP